MPIPYETYFEGYLKVKLEWPDVRQCSHSGDCWEDVNRVMAKPYVQEQFAAVQDHSLKRALMDHGAWTGQELLSRQDDIRRIVWVAANNILEEEEKFHTADPRENGEHWLENDCYFCQLVEETNGNVVCNCHNADIGSFAISSDDVDTLDGWIQDHHEGYVSLDTLKELKRRVEQTNQTELDLAERVCAIFGWEERLAVTSGAPYERLCFVIRDAYNGQSEGWKQANLEITRLNKHITKLDDEIGRLKSIMGKR